MWRIASVLGCVLLAAVAGCGTVANVTLSPMPHEYSDRSAAAPFGGVANDLATLRQIPMRVGTPPPSSMSELAAGMLARMGEDALEATCYIVDLPLSLAGDCVTLPLVLAGAFDKARGAERTTKPSTIDPDRPTSNLEAASPAEESAQVLAHKVYRDGF